MHALHLSLNQLAMFGLGTTEIVILLIVIVMVFGLGKLPLVAKQLGAGVRDFQRSVRGDEEDDATPPKQQLDKEQPGVDVKADAEAKSRAY